MRLGSYIASMLASSMCMYCMVTMQATSSDWHGYKVIINKINGPTPLNDFIPFKIMLVL